MISKIANGSINEPKKKTLRAWWWLLYLPPGSTPKFCTFSTHYHPYNKQ
jgi:hypothetical protein